jgi:hypothetical protein
MKLQIKSPGGGIAPHAREQPSLEMADASSSHALQYRFFPTALPSAYWQTEEEPSSRAATSVILMQRGASFTI